MIKTYYNPDDECWWAYVVDSEGNQVGDAEPAPTQKLAKKYLKMFVGHIHREGVRVDSSLKTV